MHPDMHEHIQATVMPEINTKINQSITESQDPELPELIGNPWR
jgi:hypothetical protein